MECRELLSSLISCLFTVVPMRMGDGFSPIPNTLDLQIWDYCPSKYISTVTTKEDCQLARPFRLVAKQLTLCSHIWTPVLIVRRTPDASRKANCCSSIYQVLSI
ncbi:hypothetical protein ACS0TY_004073 [Phlomoides rotata]